MSHHLSYLPGTSLDDILAFSTELANGQVMRFEDFTQDAYLNSVITKPWGHEYRIYADMLIDVWKLMLAPDQSTSMHCHPRKETVLMCLGGALRINFLNHSVAVRAGQYVRIPKGAFHSTDNVGSGDAHLIEVETPRNKFDLIRRKDRYGREGTQYETQKSLQDIAPLEDDETQAYARIRRHDLQGLFHFDVLTGAQIKHAPRPVDFAVSLALESAIDQHIHIHHHAEDNFTQLKSEGRYLAISQR
ncbi:MAG: cupin domain-containing protein [Aquabacterium sp.]|uniref:cupin domain-containing protein n=1 Tax=Aquabacterium sp. TaxID=1872578 RepID=UPI0025C28039|nr:cupin domain-containing protein [Aquabacterium sp.]MBI5924940.1 cupin domain-containing protein [Aquabacterium sp.]